MSLSLDIDRVIAVLLADGWHVVAEDSFFIDSYEFVCGTALEHGGGDSGICAIGFSFLEAGNAAFVSGPLTSVLAVRTK